MRPVVRGKSTLIVGRENTETGSHVSELIEVGDLKDQRATRRRIMLHVGKLVDELLEGGYGTDHITIERNVV